ncbi:MAG: L-rhamnose mutarotase [Candidatus Latescibacteria bacterium]|jgi:L-rhamnose mutarotase|nr:L-rhamnose mutarotase [Candidatus Latescibacterota bacterium]
MTAPKRYGMVLKVKPEKIDEYKEYHAEIWPGVADMIAACNIRNYSIYLKDDHLFSYFEYVGSDFKVDMDRMAQDPTTQKWWDVMMPMQEPLTSRKEGEWWADMEEVFHQE